MHELLTLPADPLSRLFTMVAVCGLVLASPDVTEQQCDGLKARMIFTQPLDRCHRNATCAALSAASLHAELVSEFPNAYCHDPRLGDAVFVAKHHLAFGFDTGLWTTPAGKIMVPQPLVQKILHAHHSSPLAGHNVKT